MQLRWIYCTAVTVILEKCSVYVQCDIQSIFGECFNPLSTNTTIWSNTLKQFVGNLPTNFLSVFDHFVELAIKGLNEILLYIFTWCSGSILKLFHREHLTTIPERSHEYKPFTLKGNTYLNKATAEVCL